MRVPIATGRFDQHNVDELQTLIKHGVCVDGPRDYVVVSPDVTACDSGSTIAGRLAPTSR